MHSAAKMTSAKFIDIANVMLFPVQSSQFNVFKSLIFTQRKFNASKQVRLDLRIPKLEAIVYA